MQCKICPVICKVRSRMLRPSPSAHIHTQLITAYTVFFLSEGNKLEKLQSGDHISSFQDKTNCAKNANALGWAIGIRREKNVEQWWILMRKYCFSIVSQWCYNARISYWYITFGSHSVRKHLKLLLFCVTYLWSIIYTDYKNIDFNSFYEQARITASENSF